MNVNNANVTKIKPDERTFHQVAPLTPLYKHYNISFDIGTRIISKYMLL